MEEHFILRVPQSVAERLERILNEDPGAAADGSLDLAFQEDGRTGCFTIGEDRFPASLLDLPCVLESYKTYDDNVLIKTADIGQMIMVREDGEQAPEGPEYKHGLTPAMRDARRRRFRREPDLNVVEQEEDADDDAEAEEPAPKVSAGSKKSKAAAAAAAAAAAVAPPTAKAPNTDPDEPDEPLGDDDYDDLMDEDEED